MVPPRDHVFYLTFPKHWKGSDINELFSPFGGVYVSWIDDSSAFVSLHRRDQAAIALSTLSQSDTYSIMTYAKRKAILEGHSLLPKSPTLKKRFSSEQAYPVTKRRKTGSFGE